MKLHLQKQLFSQPDARVAHAKLYDWYRHHPRSIDKVYGRNDAYAKYSKLLISKLPVPSRATAADMSYVAREVLTGLLEWSYHQYDQSGIAMHQYARVIMNEYGNVDPRRSRLTSLRNRYVHARGY